MADKEKRIQKFLTKARLKGKLKTVKTIEEATIVIVEDPRNKLNNVVYDKTDYQRALSKGETFPEDRVHFLTSTNPRNRRLVERGIFTKRQGLETLPA